MLKLFKYTYEEGLEKITHKRAYKFIGKIFIFLFITTLGFFSFLMFSTTSVFASEDYQTETDNVGMLDSFFSYQEIEGANYLLEGGSGKDEVGGRRVLSLDYNDCDTDINYSRKLDTVNQLQSFDLYFWNSNSLWETLTLNGNNKQLVYSNISDGEEVNDGAKYSLTYTGTSYSPYTLFVKKPNWRESTYKYVDFSEGTTKEDALQTSYSNNKNEAYDNYDYPADETTRGEVRYNNANYKSVLSGDSAKSNNGKYYNATKVSNFYTTYENTTANKGSDNSNNISVGDDYVYDNTPSNTYDYIYDKQLISNISLYAYQHPTDSYVLVDYQGKRSNETGFKTYPYYDTNSKQLCVWNGTSFTVYDTSGSGYYNESNFDLNNVANENGNIVFFDANKIVKYYKLWNALVTETSVDSSSSSTTYKELSNSISQSDYDTLVDTASKNPQVDGSNKYTTYSQGNLIGYLANYTYDWTYVNDKVFDYTNTYKQQQYAFKAIPQSYTDTYTKNKSTSSTETLLSTLNSKTNVSSYSPTNTTTTYYEYDADNWDNVKTNIFKSNNYTFSPSGTYTKTYGDDRLSQGAITSAYYNGTSYSLYKSGNDYYYNPVTTNYQRTETKTAEAVYKNVDNPDSPIYSYDYSKPIGWEQVFDHYEQKVIGYGTKYSYTKYTYYRLTMNVTKTYPSSSTSYPAYSKNIYMSNGGSGNFTLQGSGGYYVYSISEYDDGNTHNHDDGDKPSTSNHGDNSTCFTYLLASDIRNRTDGTDGKTAEKYIYTSSHTKLGSSDASKWGAYYTGRSGYYYNCTGFSDSCGWFGNQYDFNWERVYLTGTYYYNTQNYAYTVSKGANQTSSSKPTYADSSYTQTVTGAGKYYKDVIVSTEDIYVTDYSAPIYGDDTSKPVYRNGDANDWATYISGYNQMSVVDYYSLSFGSYSKTSDSTFSVTFYGWPSGTKPNSDYIHTTRVRTNPRTTATVTYYWYTFPSYTTYEKVSVSNAGTVLIQANKKMSKTDIDTLLSKAGESSATINKYIEGCDKYIKGYTTYTNSKADGSWTNVNNGTDDYRNTTSKVTSYYSDTVEGKPSTSGNTTTVTFTRTYYRYDGLVDTSTNKTKTFTSGEYNTSGNYNAWGETSPLNNKADGSVVYRFVSTSQPSLNSTNTVDYQTSTYSVRQTTNTDYSKTSTNSAYYGNQKPTKYPSKSIDDSASANDVLHTPTTSVTFTPLYAYTKTVVTYTYNSSKSTAQVNYGSSSATTTTNDYKKNYRDSVVYTSSGIELANTPTGSVEINTMTNINKVDQSSSFINTTAKKYISNGYFYVNGTMSLSVASHNNKTGDTISFTTTDVSKVSVYVNGSSSKANLTSLGDGRYSYKVSGGKITSAKIVTTTFVGLKDIMIAEDTTVYTPFVKINNEYSVNTTKYYGYTGTKSYNYDYYNAMYSKEMKVTSTGVEKTFDFNINDYVYKATENNAKITFTYPDKLSWQYKVDNGAVQSATNSSTITINLSVGQKVNVKACLATYTDKVFNGSTEYRDSINVDATTQNATVVKETKSPSDNEKIVIVAKLSRDVWYKRVRKDNLVYSNASMIISNDDPSYKYSLQGVTTKDAISFDEETLKNYIKLSDGKYYPMNAKDTLYKYLYDQNQYVVRYYYNNSFWVSPDSREYKRKLTLYVLNTTYGIGGYTVVKSSDADLLSKENADKIVNAVSEKYGKNSYLVDINAINNDLATKATTSTSFKDSLGNNQSIQAFLPLNQNASEKYALYMNNYLYTESTGNNNSNFLIYIDDSLVKEGLSDTDTDQKYYYLSVEIDGKYYMLRSNFKSAEYNYIDNGPKQFKEVYTSTMKGSWEKAEDVNSYFKETGSTNVINLVKVSPVNEFVNLNTNLKDYYKDTKNNIIYIKTTEKANDKDQSKLSENVVYNYFTKNAKTNTYDKNYNTLIVINDKTQGIYKLYEKVDKEGTFVYLDNNDTAKVTNLTQSKITNSKNVYQIEYQPYSSTGALSSSVKLDSDTLSDFILYSKYENAKESSLASQNLYMFDKISKDNVSFGVDEVVRYNNWANIQDAKAKYSYNKDNELYKLLKHLTETASEYLFDYEQAFPVGRDIAGHRSGLEDATITDDIWASENLIMLTYNFATTDFPGVMTVEKSGTASTDYTKRFYCSPTKNNGTYTTDQIIGEKTVQCYWTVNDLLTSIKFFDGYYQDYDSLYEALVKKGAMNDVFYFVNKMTEARENGNTAEYNRISALLLKRDGDGISQSDAQKITGALGLRTSALSNEGVLGMNIILSNADEILPEDVIGADQNIRFNAGYNRIGVSVFADQFGKVTSAGEEIEEAPDTIRNYDSNTLYEREVNAYNLGFLRDKNKYYTIQFYSKDVKTTKSVKELSVDPSNYFNAFSSGLNDYNSKTPYIILNQYLPTGCRSGESATAFKDIYGNTSRTFFIENVNHLFNSIQNGSVRYNDFEVPKTIYTRGGISNLNSYTIHYAYDFLPNKTDYSEVTYQDLANVIFQNYTYGKYNGYSAYSQFCKDYGLTNVVEDAITKYNAINDSHCCKYFTDAILFNKIYYNILVAYLSMDDAVQAIEYQTQNSQFIDIMSDEEASLWTNKFKMVYGSNFTKNNIQELLNETSMTNFSDSNATYYQFEMLPKTRDKLQGIWIPNEQFIAKSAKIQIASKFYISASDTVQTGRFINFREKKAGSSLQEYIQNKYKTKYGNLLLYTDSNCQNKIDMANGFVIYKDVATGKLSLYTYPSGKQSFTEFNPQSFDKVYYFVWTSDATKLNSNDEKEQVESQVSEGKIKTMTIEQLLKFLNFTEYLDYTTDYLGYKAEDFEIEYGTTKDPVYKKPSDSSNITSIKESLEMYNVDINPETTTLTASTPIDYNNGFLVQCVGDKKQVTKYNSYKETLIECIEKLFKTSNEYITLRVNDKYVTYKKVNSIKATSLLFKGFGSFEDVYDDLTNTFTSVNSTEDVEITTPDYLEHYDDIEVSTWYNIYYIGTMNADCSKMIINNKDLSTFTNYKNDNQAMLFVDCQDAHNHDSSDYGDNNSVSGYLISQANYNDFEKLIREAIKAKDTPQELKSLNPDKEEYLRDAFIQSVVNDNSNKIDDTTIYLKDINAGVIGSKYSFTLNASKLYNSLEFTNKAKLMFSLKYMLNAGESPKNGFVLKNGWAYYQWPETLLFKQKIDTATYYFNALDSDSGEQTFADLPSGRTLYIVLGVEELSGATVYTKTIKLETEEDMVRNPYNPTGIATLSNKENDILNVGTITYKDFQTMFMLNETGYNYVMSSNWAKNIVKGEDNSFESTSKLNRDIISDKYYRFYKTTLPKVEIQDIAFRFDIGYYQDNKWIDIDSSATNYMYSNSIKLCNKDKTLTTYYERWTSWSVNGTYIGYNTSNSSSGNTSKKYFSLEKDEVLKKAFYNECNADIQKFLEYILDNFILDVSEATYNKLKDKNVRLRLEFWYYDSFIYTDFNRDESFTADTGKVGGTEIYMSSSYQESTKEEKIFGNKATIDTTNTSNVISTFTQFQKVYDQNINHKLGTINEKDYRAIELKNVDSKTRYVLLLVNDDGSGWIVS